MAEETKSILLQVKIDADKEQQKIVDLEKQIRLVRKEEQELAKTVKEAGSATDEQISKQLQLKGTLKELTTEQRASQNVVQNLNKINQAQSGSITQLRAELSVLTKAWNDLSEEERENAEVGGKLQAKTKATSDQLKQLEAKVGDTRRQVGDYTGGILNAVDGTGLLATITGKMKGVQEAYTATLNITRASIVGNVSALKLLKLALAATGIGAVLLLLGGLISFLTRTQEGLDKVSVVTKSFTTVIGALTDRVSAIGKAMFDWFSDIENAGDLFTKLGDIIKENLINRVKAFGVILEAIRTRDFTKLQDGIFQVGTGIEDASGKAKAFVKDMKDVAKAAAEVERENQRIREAERALTVEREKANVIIAKNRLIAEDMSRSEGERIKAAKAAEGELQRITDKQLQLQRDRITNMEKEQSLTNNLTADNDALAQEKQKLSQIEAQAATRGIELQNKLNSITKQGADKRRAATMAQLKAEADLLEVRVNNTQNSEEDILELKLAILKKKTEIELKAENLTQLEIQAIKARALQEEAKLKDAYREEQRKRELAEAERTAKLASETALKVMQAANTRQDMALKQQRAKGLISAQQYERQQENLKLLRMQRELMLLEQFAGKIAGQDEKIAAKRVEVSNYLADRQIENQNKVEANAQLNAEREAERLTMQAEETAAFVQSIGDVFAASLDQQGLDLQKFAQGVLLVTIDAIEKAVQATAAEAILRATALSMASPESVATAGAAGVIKAGLLAGLIKGAFAIFKAQLIRSQEPVKAFSEGGYTGDGGKYEPAGIVHKGEYVLTKKMVQTNPELVAQLERMRLKGYADGGMVSGLAPSVRSYFSSGQADPINYDKIAQAVAKVNVYTKVTDINNGQSRQASKARIINQ
jgi:hypothetical protein